MHPQRHRDRRCDLSKAPGLHASTITVLKTQAHSPSDEQRDDVVFVIQPKGSSLNEKCGNSTDSLDVGLWPSGAG